MCRTTSTRGFARSVTRTSCAVAGAAAIGLVALAAALQPAINRRRQELQLVTSPDIQNVPPRYMWLTAMAGSFRGLAVDFLWMRAEQLKQDGKYYESNQLADWICMLQPRFAMVWANRAWDLSYNISVGTHTPEERWQWVYNGIRLLRDRGIPNNPRVLPLYKELSWIFFHKIGDLTDDMHWYYKREWAALMENVLGPPPVSDDAQVVVDAFRPVAEAPERLDKLLAEYPEIEPALDRLLKIGIDVTAETDPDQLVHPLERTFFDRYGRLIQGTDVALGRYRGQPRKLDADDQAFVDIWSSLSPEAGGALLSYLRAKVLREQYKMDPRFMLSLMTDMIPGRPGVLVPLDWRMPEASAIYWSRYGVSQGTKLKNFKENDVLNTDRFTLYALMTLFKRGLMIFELNRAKPNQSAIYLAEDLRMLEPMHEMFLALGKVHAEEGEDPGNTAGQLLRSGHVNTLEQGIALLYARGDVASANRYYTYLRENYMGFDGKPQKRYMVDLETFVLGEIKELTENYSTAVALIHQFIRGSMLSLIEGNTSAAQQQVARARLVHSLYGREHADERFGRMKLLPFEDMYATALFNFLRTMPSLIARAHVWAQIDPTIKQRVYDAPGLVPYLRAQCEERGIDVAKAFPEPPGMAAYRAAHPAPDRPEEADEKLFEVPEDEDAEAPSVP
jgi:hypothetical protein